MDNKYADNASTTTDSDSLFEIYNEQAIRSSPTNDLQTSIYENTTENMMSRRPPRVLQNFILIWLDAKINERKKDFRNSFKHLKHLVASITTFTDPEECITFISEIKQEKIFMIVSGSLGQHIVSKIHDWTQVDSIYVFCRQICLHEQWAKNIFKVKGVYDRIEQICEALRVDRERCDRSLISISFHGIDPSFMYTQLFKEALLKIEDDDNKSTKDFVEYCRLQDDIPTDEIEKFEKYYNHHPPIWWYTAPYFLYSILNRGLRLLDTDIILKMGFFIRQLHRNIEKMYHEQQSTINIPLTPLLLFRGQGLQIQEFDKMKQTKNGLMCFNNFLSTSLNRHISLEKFARPAALGDPSLVGILFVMTIDRTICTVESAVFVDVKDVGYYKDKEQEFLFTTHTIFRVDGIEQLHDNLTDRLWLVNLTLIDNKDPEMNALMNNFRSVCIHSTGWESLGSILNKIGEFEKAEQLYRTLLERASSDRDRSTYHQQLGLVYQRIGKYSMSLSSHEQALDIQKKSLPDNHPSIADSYNNIGNAYNRMGEYSKALSSHKQALAIRETSFPPNHLTIGISCNNIGLVYYSMEKYSDALISHERALAIRKNLFLQIIPTLLLP